MITKIEIKNYKSIADAVIKLSPFTLLIGANGSGKSNFLELLDDISTKQAISQTISQKKHFNNFFEKQKIEIWDESILTTDPIITFPADIPTEYIAYGNNFRKGIEQEEKFIQEIKPAVFSIEPSMAGEEEALKLNPRVERNGAGTVQVLDSLKTGDREDLFNKIESYFKEFIPEIEKLSFIPTSHSKKLQVRIKHIKQPVPVSQVSEGTQLILIILTILYQENPPSIICIEDIDRGLHPRLYEKIIELCFQLTKNNNFQIIATTHNPYLVDYFKDNEGAVVIVEKKDGNTTFTTLEERMNNLDSGEVTLGELWYSGIMGGVPENE